MELVERNIIEERAATLGNDGTAQIFALIHEIFSLSVDFALQSLQCS
jgi:hypothetical protein